MSLEDLGWDERWAAAAAAVRPDLAPARIAVEHRGAYEAIGAGGTLWAELRGKAYADAKDKRELPTVGDWVLLAGPAIEAILPRRSMIVRAAAGERAMPQPIAANVDVAFVVTSANLDLNVRRLERYLTAITAGGARAVVVLNKIDLVADAAPLVASIAAVANGAPILATSAAHDLGIAAVRAELGRATGVVVGSSGVGKSTLLNRLLGAARQEVQPVRGDDDRGRHTTTRRALFVLDGGGTVIDTPGMRALEPWLDDDDDLGFTDIEALAAQCRFADCKHEGEPGCAVAGAVAADRIAAWRKLLVEHDAQAARRRGRTGAKSLRARLRDKNRE